MFETVLFIALLLSLAGVLVWAFRQTLSEDAVTEEFIRQGLLWEGDEDEAIAMCKHCGEQIQGSIHITGRNQELQRCNPKDSGLEYGYNAEPVGSVCKRPCLGEVR